MDYPAPWTPACPRDRPRPAPYRTADGALASAGSGARYAKWHPLPCRVATLPARRW